MSKSNKTAKFLLCENPIANEKNDGKIYILHNREPKIFAEVFHFDGEGASYLDCQRSFDIGGKLDYQDEVIIFGAHWMLPDEKFLKLDTQAQADECAAIMRRMADWYESYLIWQDNEIENENI
jgi:hypothetical protein